MHHIQKRTGWVEWGLVWLVLLLFLVLPWYLGMARLFEII